MILLAFPLFFSLFSFIFSQSISVTPQIIANKLSLNVVLNCPLSTTKMALSASLASLPFFSWDKLYTGDLNKDVDKFSSSWQFFKGETFANTKISNAYNFPAKAGGSYAITGFCENGMQTIIYEAPSSKARLIVSKVSFISPLSKSVVASTMNALSCCIQNKLISQKMAYKSFYDSESSCIAGRLLADILPISQTANTAESFLSLVPEWDNDFDTTTNFNQVNMNNLFNDCKSVSQNLYDISIIEVDGLWQGLPDAKIAYYKFSNNYVQLNVTNAGSSGFIVFESALSGAIQDSYVIYLQKGESKIVQLGGLTSMKRYTLSYRLSSGDFSLNGRKKEKVSLEQGFVTFPQLDVSFDLTKLCVIIAASSTADYQIYLGVGEKNKNPTEATLLGLQDINGLKYDALATSLQSSDGKLNYASQAVLANNKAYTLYLLIEDKTDKTLRTAIFSKTVSVPEYPILEIAHDYAFNVDPTNFLGFSHYHLNSNAAKTKIYAALLECAETEIPTLKELQNLFFNNAPLDQKWCFIYKWQGEVNSKNEFVISYNKYDTGEELAPLKEKTKYTVAYFGQSENAVDNGGVEERKFTIPDLNLYKCGKIEISL